ncbi:MAG TPA: hypothetical protein PK079_25650 [Leptospiraceae bacterium]|nr:hypothetical protein [Leptospiraceae bacterium]HMW07298.1 hypothetical protein [Leptospiraceae bacterium]HMX33747.1 hypothetical protein [Leptospiraceae bacterium]HMY32884.1 hypothetical protein [Leptospiraceae bacterium]HMZ65953.1 hypothetical protein [Leptospiraceae bacterium]
MKKIFIIVVTLYLPTMIFADRIVLKNGKAVVGTVQNQENNMVTIVTTSGERLQIKKDEIVSMIYVETTPKKKPVAPRPVTPAPAKIVSEKKEETSDLAVNSTPEKVQVNNNERVVEKTEKVTVDKELTNNVMQKFEDADKRRQQSTDSEIKVLKEELEYLKKERERLQRLNQGDEDFKRTMDKRMASLELRIRRLEKYLAMDETMVDYYQRKRSPWDLVWRSALFPGWGHRYAKEEYTGNTYSTTILVLLGLGYFFNYQANAAEESAKNTLFNNTVVKGYQYSALGIPVTYSNTFLVSSYSNYVSTMSAIDTQKTLSGNLYNAAIALYLIQLVHAYFTGVEWAKVQPRDYSNEGLLKPTSFNIRSKPDTNFYSRVPERGMRYELEFITRF